MKFEDMTNGAYRLRVENEKDLRMLKAFIHLDHFIINYDDASLHEAINMIATDEEELETHINELAKEIAADSTFDDEDVDQAPDIMEAV